MNSTFSVQQGFADADRLQAATLYDAAFGAKLGIAIPDRKARLAVLAEGMDPQSCFVVYSGPTLVGIAGFKSDDGALTGKISFAVLRRHLGFFGAIRAAAVLTLFDRRLKAGQLLMDGIAVASDMRNCGIGSRLLVQMANHARKRGYAAVRLDVIDTNPSARRLYERFGFKPTRTEYFPRLKWLLGFSSATQMEFALKEGASL